MAGIGTVLADDPQLTVRHVETARQPMVVIVDRHLQLPPTARVLDADKVLVVAAREDPERMRVLAAAGATVMILPDAAGKVDLAALLLELGRREVNEVLVESGNRLNGALLRAGVVDELLLYLAPHLLGDSARGMFDLQQLTALEQRVDLQVRDVRRVGADLRILARVR